MTKYPFHKLSITNKKEYDKLRWQEYKKNINRTEYFSKRWKKEHFCGISSTYSHKARKYRGNKCERCGATENLVAHHKNQNQKDNRPSNIQTLCITCHNQIHRLKNVSVCAK